MELIRLKLTEMDPMDRRDQNGPERTKVNRIGPKVDPNGPK